MTQGQLETGPGRCIYGSNAALGIPKEMVWRNRRAGKGSGAESGRGD